MTAQTLSPQMSSFPKFIRKSEQSTRGLDGAFPPFKIEHRYKSVYERAGFDVNKGGNGTHHSNDSRSLTSRKARNPYSNNNNSSSSNNVNTRLQDDSPAGSPVLQKNRAPSLPINSQMRHNSQPNSDSDSPSASSHSSKTSSVNSNFTNSKSSSSRSTFRNTDEFSPVFEQPLTTGSSTTTFFNDSNEPENKTQSYQPPVISPNNNNNTTNAHDEQGPDQFDFSPSSNHSRNQKNLKLDLNNDNISDTQSLPGISKVESQQHTITNPSLHSAGSNGTAQTHQQVEPQQVPTITINEEQQRQQEEKPKDIYAQQGFQVAPPSQPANAAPPAKFDPRKQRSIRGHPTTQQGQGQQQRVPYPPNGDGQVTAQTVPYPGNAHQTRVMSPTGVQTRNMSPTSMHHQTRNMSPTGTQHPMPPHPHHRNGSRPSSPKLGGANGAHVPQLPMMSLNSPTSAYRPSQRPQSLPHNHHQHQQQPQQPVEPPRTRQQATYSQIRDDKLSSALNDFKNDVENHKTGGSGAGRSPTGSNTSLDDDEVPSSSTPSDLGLYKSDSKEDSSNDNSRFSYGNNLNGGLKDGFDPSAQFQNFASQQVAKDANLNNEYAEFLASQNNEQDQTKKNPHLSMVSSILSKASGNSEDDEIERELERQLQSLKMSGSTIDISKTESNNSRNSFGYGANSANGGVIPLFNIQDVDEVDEEEEEYTKPLSISGTYSFIEKSATTGEEDDEMTRPLTIHSRESNEESEPNPNHKFNRNKFSLKLLIHRMNPTRKNQLGTTPLTWTKRMTLELDHYHQRPTMLNKSWRT
ncbi:hypothetical protein Cantr_06898 [Candida viswanathii]|uniref:Uncharacterized protein n=1 Tax=Candida viswanathii TaxID=5486 RepID=A0A367XUV4_9ASCO|nr:hypothetical protein Cantr_06898 [Candida viswanathii]